MAIFIKRTTNARLYEDATEKDCLFAQPDSRATVTVDTVERYVSGKFSVAASGSEALSLGDVTTGRGVYIRFDGNAQIQLNGGADTIDIEPETTAQSTGTFFMTGPVSAVQVLNPSATTALTGTYVIWGDPTS